MSIINTLNGAKTADSLITPANQEPSLYAILLDGRTVDEIKTPAGYRTIRLGWKGNKETGRVAYQARYIQLPVVDFSIEGTDRAFLPMLTEAFYEHQKTMVHKAVTEALDNTKVYDLPGLVQVSVPAAAFTKQAVFADWDSQETTASGESRGKLSKDAIKVWYETTLQDVIVATLAEKAIAGGQVVESEEQLEPFARAAANYGKVLQLLASPKPAVTIQQGKMLQKALELLPEGAGKIDAVLVKLSKKLDGVVNPVGVEDMLASL